MGRIYGLALFALVGWLVYRHVQSDATERSKRRVVGLTVVAVFLCAVWPSMFAAAFLMAIGVYVVLYREMTSSG